MDPQLRILVVDDDTVDRMAVRRALRDGGLEAEVREADDAPVALDLLAREAFDCVMLDLRLPTMDGLELLRTLRAQGVQTPVVMLTGQGDERTAVELMKAGAADYFAKSALSPTRLAQSVRHAVRVERAERATRAAQAEAAEHLARSYAAEARARADAEAANRAKDEFLAVLSHELRTPLNSILGWARMLRTGELPEDKRARAIETIERNAQMQTQLIEDLLDVSRIITGKLRIDARSMDLRRAVESAVDVVRAAAEARGVELVVTIEPAVGRIVGDAARLEQVVWNLLTNAVKFASEGGRVALDVRAAADHVRIVVADNGQGIPPDFLPHVFERFRQADASSRRARGGLGLGLSIVHHLVELHGGTIEARSDGVGRGATFVVVLPRRGAGDALASSPPATLTQTPAHGTDRPHPGAPLEGTRVLLVDDDDDAREMMAEALAQEGALVTSAASVAAALVAFGADVPDVLVSDIGMPGEDGYALIRSVRLRGESQGGRVPAVALTGYAGLEDQRLAREAGFDCHVTKPVDFDELLVALARLTRRGRGAHA